MPSDPETRKRQNENLKPIKGYAYCKTEEERQKVHEHAVKAGLKRGEQIKAQKTLKDVCNDVLQTRLTKVQAMTYLGDDVDFLSFENGYETMQAVMAVRAMRIYADGNVKAGEFLRDTSGQKPKDDINITADVITAADRALIENINARLNAVDP